MDEIIKRFTAKETVFREALGHYTYRRAVRVQTLAAKVEPRQAPHSVPAGR